MSNAEPIAIIGSGCRFPGGANSPAKLWELLQHPRDVSAKVPRERFNLDGFYDQDPRNPGTTNSSQSYFLDERVDEFDAAFFNISQNEAESMDPQQRLMLETVYEALESAGLRMEDLHGSQTGIYCGVMCDDYRSLAFQDLGGLPPHAATGTSAALLSNRVSYFYGWRGPSITVDTACSSSLVAVHLAAQALSQGDCNVALAAGANLILSPNVHVSESNLNMLSPTGHCHMWDIQADGYARGEGVAAVVLKRLGNAIADGDYIESVIRATGVNQDGRTNGITMPSSQAQSDLIIRTYQRAGLDPVNRPDDRCQYFEAHGTGTPVGDPQEARAIHDAFFSRSPALAQKNLYVGSIKTLIGHTEGTAGLAGLLKASLAVHHAMIPPNLHFHTLNPDIAPYARSLHIPIDLVPWPKMTSEKPRRASVNSFGFGGTNAHVIVESYGPQPSESTSSQGSNSSESVTLPFVFSAGSERALRALLSRYHDFLDESSGAILIQDLAWSLWERRSSLRSRLCICTSSIENLKVQISEHVKEGFSKFTLASRSSSQKNKIIGIFTGQGAQWAQMGLKLIETYPMAKHWLNELQQFLDSLPGEYGGQSFSLATEIAASTNKTRMNQALVSQPVTTAVQIILVQLLQAMAIQLDVVVGHSSGEIAASYAAGFLSASDCIRIAFLRGQFSHTAAMDKSQRGAMLAVGMTHDEAETLCSKAQWMGRVNVAAYNSPTSITLSGDEDAIQELSALLQAAGTFARTLKVDMAYHSHHMSACADKYAAALESCQIRPLQQRSSTSWWSSVHGDHLMTGDDRDDIQSNYWVRNLVSPVRFNQAVIAATHHHKLNLAIEIGPHPALKGPFQQSSDDLTIPYTGTLQRGADDIRSIASMIATCWRYLGSQCWNIKPYIQGLFPARELSHVQEMPLYPFDHLNRYWIKSQRINATLHPKQPQTHLLGALSPDCMEGEWRWRNHFRLQEFSWLLQNVHQPGINLPIAGYVGMVLQAGYVAVSDRLVRFLEIADLSIQQQIAFDTDGRVETMASAKITAQDETTTQLHFTCSYSTDGTLKPCASALLIITHAVSASTSLPARLMDCTGMISSNPNKFYAELDRLGYHGTCRGIDNFTLEGQVVHGMITSGDSISLGSDLLWHPQVLESAIQGLLLAIFDDNPRGLAGILQCTGIQRILINPKMLLHEETSARFIAAVQDTAGYPVIGDIDIFDQAGHAMMQVEEISLTVSNKQFIQKSQSLFSGLYWGPLNPKPLFHSTEIDQREHISMAAQQVFFRYPQAKALELETTDKEHVYKTVAHESLGCLYSADTQSSPSCHETHSGSRKLDLDQDPADQAFLQQTYDLVILSSDSKSQVSLIQSLTRLRKLLKSGGYLLIHARPRPAIPQEPQSTFCQEKKPTISLGQLDLNLRQSRFSGIGTSLDQNSSSEWHNYVIVSQAVDETVQLLLEPLPAAKKNAIQRPLYIISDEASSASETIKSLELLLGDCFQVVLTLTRQQLLQTKPQAQNSCVLYFGDPEQLYSQIDGNEVDNVSEQIARGSSHLLCVTETDQPHLQGITRSNLHGLSKYNTSLRFQHLSINAGGSIPTIVIAECLLRLIQCPWANSYDMKTHLWTTEPRLHWEKGQFQIPRLKPAVARNERAIAEHQDLYQLVNPQQESVRLISSPTSRHFIRSPVKPTEKGVTQIKVELSSLSALPLSKSISLYLVMGIEIKSGRKVVALSKENGSVIPTPVEWVHQHEDQEDISQEDSFNRLIMSFLSIFIVDQADPHSTMVVHESDALLRGYITSYGKQRCVSPFFTNSTLDPQSTDRFIHPMTSNRDLQRILPNNVSFILRCRAKSWDIFSRVRLASCPSVTVASVHTLCTPNSQLNEVKNSLSSVKQILELANILSKDQPSPELRTNALPVITPQQIQNGTMSDGSLAVIDWTPFAPVQVLVQKASAQLSFSPHRLYLLAGLPEQIGRWITEFIVEGGARNIVLATHKIAAEQGWVKRMHERGVNLRTMLTDTARSATNNTLHQIIDAEFEMVGGVIAGKLELCSSDIDLRAVRELATRDLDFFVGVVLNDLLDSPSVSSFRSCAERMTRDLVSSRRYQGLAGSIVYCGLAEGDNSQAVSGNLMLSRSDFREAVAESILSASSETTDPSDVILGSLFSNASKESNCVLWSLFSSLVDGSPTEQPTVDKKALSLKENLTEIMDSEEQDDQKVDQIDDLLEIHIMAMIRQTLRMNSDDPIGPSTVLIDLGVDSLVASNLRSWFASEFNVGISVLTILDGASVTDLVQQVTQELMRATLDPQISTSSSSSNQSVHTDVTSASEPEVLKTDGYCRVEELSYAQSRYLFLHQYLGDRTAFNVTLSFRINGIPRISDLEAAVQIVSQRHESLRTCYLGIEGSEQVKPCQAILFKPTVHLEVSHVQDMTQLQNEYTALHSHQYSLECGQSIRLRLVTLPPGKGSSFLMIGYPHMCMDGASLLNLLGELDVAYRKEKLPPVSRQYPDFASAQRNAYETGQFALESEFWQKELLPLPEPIPLLPMAKSRSRPSLKDYHTEEVQLNVPWDLMELIGTVCRKNRATRFHFFLGVLRVLLARLTDAEDFCIGIADSNRMDTANHNTVGFLLNLLPVRFKTEVSNESIEFQSTLSDTRDRCYQALRHSSMPFDMLLGELAVPRCNTHSPIFQVLMDWQPQLGSELPLGDESIVCEEMGVGRTVYDLTLLITESSRGDATVHFRLQKALYSHEAAELVSRSFLHLLEAFAGDPTLRLQAPRVWHPSDIQRALELGQGPSYDSQWPSTISRRIEEVSRNQPGNSIAVEDTEGNCWTYSRLMDRVQQLAYVLQSIGGVKPGLFVCIFQHPTAEWVCIMLAIWRLGAVYVPLDLRNPPARLANMVSDCQPTVIVCNQETHADIASLECPTAAVINTTSIRPYPQEITDSIPDVSDPEAPSAILYTSGTTGKPKGIMLRHSSLRNQVEGYVRRWQLGAETVLQQGAMTFNHSLDQMLTGLCNGGRLIVASKAVRGDPVSLTKLIVDKGITYTKATPAEYAMWLQYGSSALRGAAHSWRHAFGGGEHLTVSLSRAFRQLGLPYLQLYNSYGPGEITISSHKSPINYQEAEPSISGSIFPIGYSLPNYATYVVDKDMSLLPTGVSGEILIGGAGPCFGYLGRPELTAERFIANPFATPQFIARGWTTAYRTFDQGRLLRDGSLVIEGRLDGDTQVKIRGIRIELEDIENTIIQTSGGLLVGCVVSLQGDTGANDSQLLVARVVFASRIESMAQQEKQLRKLQAALPLPQYMCPSVMIPVDGLPLTIHGKVDRKAIQALPITQLPLIAGDGEKTDDTQIEVLDEMGLALAVLWRRALDPVPINMASLGRDADFFLIGGNSVMLVKLQWLIQQRFRVSVSLVDIFASSSLQAMAHILQAAPPTNVNWAEETALSLSVASSFPEPQQHVLIPPDSGVSILLTGATGFLGHTLLKVLLDNPRVSRVYAVAVRPSGRGIGRPLADCPRLTVFEGDLSQPRFGLQPSVFERLADSSHAIIHCGANRSFWDGYTILQGSNVTPTRTAIALAQHRRVPIHFLSSEAVEQIVELYDGTPSIDGRNGFLVSKWVSERLLAQANSPITIHRLSQSLKPLEPPQSVLEFFIRIACDLKCLPVMQGCDRVISLAPLTELAAGIAAQVIETILHPQAIDVAVRRHEIPLSMRLSCVVDAIHQRILTETDTAGWDTLDILYWLGKAKRATHFPWFIAAEDVISNETDGVKGAI